jgi:hypothetical protein
VERGRWWIPFFVCDVDLLLVLAGIIDVVLF